MEKFFEIEGVELFLDKIFVEFDEQEIFFSCITNSGQRFLCVCTDIDNESYIVVKTNIENIISMLKGHVTMYASIMQASYFWQVDLAEDISADNVEKMDIKRIDEELLPQRDAAFKLVTDDLKQYCSELEKELYDLNEYEFVLTGLNDNEINIVSENEMFIEQEILKIDISHQKHEYNVDISEKYYHYINDYPRNINISQLDENVYEEMNIECVIIGNIAA